MYPSLLPTLKNISRSSQAGSAAPFFFLIQIVCLIRTFGRFYLLDTLSPHSRGREVDSPDSRDPNTKSAAQEQEKKNPVEEQKVRAGLIVTLDPVDFYADSLTCLVAFASKAFFWRV